MSGRRSSNVEGRRKGIPGTPSASLPCGDGEARGRAAHQYRDRVFVLGAGDAGVDLLRLCGQQLRLRGDDVGARRSAGGILVLRDLERTLVLRDGVGQQIVQRIGFAQFEIGDGEHGLHREGRIGEIGGADLRAAPGFRLCRRTLPQRSIVQLRWPPR